MWIRSRRSLVSGNWHRLLLLILLPLFIPPAVHGQIPVKTYTSATDTFYWKRYIRVAAPKKLNLKKVSARGNDGLKAQFIQMYRFEYSAVHPDSAAGLAHKGREKYLYPADVNGDGKTDMIYGGPFDQTSEIARIYLNRGDTFELVFEDFQFFTKLELKDGKLTGFSTGDPGDKERFLYFTRDYKVSWDGNAPVIIKGKQTVTYRNTEQPVTFLPEQIPFRSKSDTLMLRASAARLNEPFQPDISSFGNIIAKYNQKTMGTILAKKTAGKGSNWFFVEMYPSTYPSVSILYGTERVPVFIRGWVHEHAIDASAN